MTVYQIETRDKDYKSIIITASYERTRKALDTAEERNVDVSGIEQTEAICLWKIF